ncbi:hypothetical protein D9M69_401270 [compost metagenome]
MIDDPCHSRRASDDLHEVVRDFSPAYVFHVVTVLVSGVNKQGLNGQGREILAQNCTDTDGAAERVR